MIQIHILFLFFFISVNKSSSRRVRYVHIYWNKMKVEVPYGTVPYLPEIIYRRIRKLRDIFISFPHNIQ